jgi:2-polyprenyl-3-methyl-5-hydroxy-6-metoxy-1,4-benzoquinol methylase
MKKHSVMENIKLTNEKMKDEQKIHSKAHIKRHNDAFEFMRYHIKGYKKEPILDIGCRDGHILEILEENGFTNLNGLDVVKKYIKNPKVNYYNCDAARMDRIFMDKIFKVVILSHVLEHVIDPEIVINQIHRILKDDGILFIEIPLETKVKPEVGHFSFFKKPPHLYRIMEDKFDIIGTYHDIKKKEALITRVWLRVIAKKKIMETN